MDRTKFGKKAIQLVILGIPISFAGTAALMFTLPVAASELWRLDWNPLSYPSFTIFHAMESSFIKGLVSMFVPFIGLMLFMTQRKKPAVIVLFASGFFTIIPLIIGDYRVLIILIQWFWIWPLLPHAISGTILIIAGVLALLWQFEERPDAAGFISTTVDSAPPSPVMRGPTCPACGHGLFGDEKYCPECAHPLRKI